MDNFAGGVAVITGGASGLGKQFAQQCADLGMHLMLADVQQDALDATVAELRAKVAAQGTQVVGVHAGLIETDMVADIPGPKTTAVDIATRIIDGLEAGAVEVMQPA